MSQHRSLAAFSVEVEATGLWFHDSAREDEQLWWGASILRPELDIEVEWVYHLSKW